MLRSKLLALALVLGAAGSASANSGVDWLSSKTQPDSSYGTATDIATAVQSTAETLSAFIVLGQNDLSGTVPARAYLESVDDRSTETLSRRIIAKAQVGESVTSSLAELKARQNADGGFGESWGFASSILDTSFALEALALGGGLGSTHGGAAVGFLTQKQNPDGSYADNSNPSSVYVTALALRGLLPYRSLYNLDTVLANARSYLLSQRDASGLWAEPYLSAHALIAVLPTLIDRSGIQASVDALQSRQLDDGSFDHDVYVTALAVKALALAQKPSPDEISLAGRILDGDTALPLSDVTLDLDGPTPGRAITDGSGVFRFGALTPGNYTLTLSKSGYAALPVITTLDTGRQTDVGDLYLLKPQQGATTGTVRGTLTDVETGQPISGASVSLSTGATASTAADGRYQISNVPAGAIALHASAPGYGSAAGSANVLAGGILVFSPRLSRGDAPPNGPTVRGVVTDATTGAPLSGVTLLVTGAGTRSTQTDGAGAYTLEGLEAAKVRIEASRADYDTVYASAVLNAEAAVIFSPGLYPTGQTPADVNTSRLAGLVVDSTTNAPLGDVSIQAAWSGRSVVTTTGTDGRFTLGGIDDADVVLQFTKAGYTAASFTLPLEPLSQNDLGQVRLRPQTAAQLLPDLVIERLQTQGTARTDPQTLVLSGHVAVTIANRGTAAANAAVALLAFHDSNFNDRFDDGIDLRLGQARLDSGLATGAVETVEIAVTGALPFRDAPIQVQVDPAQEIPESRETNNRAASTAACRAAPQPIPGSLQPALKWQWTGSAIQPASRNVMGAPIVVPLEDTNGDGRADQHDTPAVVFISYSTNHNAGGVLRAVSGQDGHELWSVYNPAYTLYGSGSLSAADLDGDGFVEIVAPTDKGGIVVYAHDGRFKWFHPYMDVAHAASVADLDADGVPELILPNAVLNADGSLRWQTPTGFKDLPHGLFGLAVDLDLDGTPEVLAGPEAFSATGQRLWTNGQGRSFIGVGNFNADPYPEIVVVAYGKVSLLAHTGQTIWGPVPLPGGGSGGPPTIANLDGDPGVEIGVAGASRYVIFNGDGSIKWSKPIQDYSSNVTGSTVFDFNQDGVAEVLYADERTFWIFNGPDGQVLSQLPNNSATVVEFPVVADVDADGHADIVLVQNGTSVGLRVFQAQDNRWVATRKIWNQHHYHIDNINDDGTVPARAGLSWQTHNSFRLNTFPDRSPLDAADLTASVIHLLDHGAGQALSLRARIGNGGLATSTPAHVAFYDGDPAAGGRRLGTQPLPALASGRFTDLSLDGVTGLSGAELYVVADIDQRQDECDETNNTHHAAVHTATALGSVQVSTGAAAYDPNTPVALKALSSNTGAAANAYVVALQIEDAHDAVVERFGPYPLGALSSGQTVPLTQGWSSAGIRAGSYVLRGILRRDDGSLVDDATASFAIGTGEGGTASLRTTTDRPVYHTTDRVQLGNLARNLAVNASIAGAVLGVEVRDPAGQSVFAQEIALGELAAGGQAERALTQALHAAAQGTYRVLGTLRDGSGAVLATDEATYQVEDKPALSVTGTVTVAATALQQGQDQTCTDTVSNRGTVDIADLPLRQTLARLDQDTTIATAESAASLAAGSGQSLSRRYSTAALDGGDYACALEAYVDGQWQGLGYATFRVIPEPTTLGVTASTDRAAYDTTDQIVITGSVQSRMQYRTVKGERLRLSVFAPSGGSIFTQILPLDDLPPATTRSGASTYNYADAAEGPYRVHVALLDRDGQVTATADAPYDIRKSPARAVTATVTAYTSVVPQGDAQTCTDTLHNSSIYVLDAIRVRQVLERTDQPQTISTADHPVDLPATGVQTLTRSFTTGTLEVGDYACRLDAFLDNEWKRLGAAGFRVDPPPIRVDATLGLGGKGRILVLLDANPPPASTGQTEPAAADQRRFLETRLTQAGWSYTLVSDKDAFAWELRSGDYSLYALLSETIKLDEPIQKELREAVYRGEGLVVTGSHDPRNNILDEALGIKHLGKHAGATGVELFGSTWTPAGYADLTLKDKVLKAQLNGAGKHGRFLGAGTTEDAAVTARTYGQGQTLYLGFDLLAEATQAGADSFYANLLVQALTQAQPAYAQTYAGQVVPLRLTLTNRGIATPGRVTLALPAGSVVVDRNTATVESNTLTWTYSLAQDEEKILTAWLRLPSEGGTQTLTAHVQTGTAPDYQDHTTATLDLDVQVRPGLAQARALASSDPAFKKVQLWLDKADVALTAGKLDLALFDLVQAADEAIKVSHSQAQNLRLMIGQALVDVGRRL